MKVHDTETGINCCSRNMVLDLFTSVYRTVYLQINLNLKIQLVAMAAKWQENGWDPMHVKSPIFVFTIYMKEMSYKLAMPLI